MTEIEDVELPEDKKKKSVCGQCWQFGYCDQHNFGRCEIDAFSDGYVIHRMYRSKCGSYQKRKCFPSFLVKADKSEDQKPQAEMLF